MELRVLNEDDARRYWPLRLRALREEPDAFGSSYDEVKDRPLEEVAERLRPHLQPPEAFTLGAFAGEELVGTVTLTREPRRKVAHKATITGMYVAPTARGQGIGKALMVEVIALARGFAGLEQIMLSVVSTNATARGLYERLGFASFGHEPHALKQDGQYLDEDYYVLWLIQPPDAAAGAAQ